MTDALRAHGLQVWIDQRSIPVTVPWMEEIEAGLRGATLMAVVDSPQWRASENCQAEIRLAEQWLVPALWLEPGTDPRTACDLVLRRLAAQPPEEKVRAELFARAGQWSINGRRSRDLVTGRARLRYRRYVNSLPAGDSVPPVVRAFLRSSITRQARKQTLRYIGTFIALVLVLVGIRGPEALDKAKDRIDQAIQSFSDMDAFQDAYETGPYEHLALLANAEGEGEAQRWELARAFSVPLPDSVTPADMSPAAPQLRASRRDRSAVSGDRQFTASLTRDGRQVEVKNRDDRLIRTIPLSFTGTTLVWSPDAAWVAVAGGEQVQLLDVQRGNQPVVLRGANSPVEAVVVADDGISALTDRGVIHWPDPFGVAVAADTDAWSGGVHLSGSDVAVLLGRHGELVAVDLASKTVVNRSTVRVAPSVITGDLAAAPDGKTLVVTGVDVEKMTSSVHVVRTVDWSVQSFPIDCVPSGVTLPNEDADIYVACGQRGVGHLNQASGEFRTVDIEQLATSIGIGGNKIFAGTNFGHVFELDPGTLQITGRAGTGCPADVSPIAVMTDGKYVFTGGPSAANFGCAARVTFGAKPKADHLIFPWQTVNRAGVVVLGVNDQQVAYGFDDGTVRVLDTGDFATRTIRRPMADPVRALALSRDGSTLLVAGRFGAVRLLDLSNDDRDNGKQRARAAAAVAQGRKLGLVR
ncbi:toll/interleukin-1 receptor domain-containing protein [Gordonia phosphorivorans]|uniref:toll/interleukin-1 receptor domain-containing protein n=1 Tax=Gordonia phosphorivorans TaxID=1056982 RepID=UPI003A8F6B60